MKLSIRVLLAFIILFVAAQLFGQASAQNNILKGRVLYQSSGNKPAVGVQIKEKDSNGDYSKDKGEYQLIFQTKRNGETLALEISPDTKEGKRIELVNEKEVKAAKLPANVEEILDIIVCPAGQRDVAAQKYYRILRTTADRELEKKKKEVEALLSQKEKDYQKISNLFAQIDGMQAALDSAKIRQQAFSIASINLDRASQMVKDAVQKIEEENDVEEALRILSAEALDTAYTLASELKKNATYTLRQAEAAIQQVIEGYIFRISLLEPQFKFKELADCYEKMAIIYETENYDQIRAAGFYTYVGQYKYLNGDYKKGIDFTLKALSIQEKKFPAMDITLANTYNNLGGVYLLQGELQKSLEFHLKAIFIKEKLLSNEHLDLGSSYSNIALTYIALAQPQKALEFNLKNLTILIKASPSESSDLARAYNNLAENHRALGQYQNQLSFNLKALGIYEKILSADNPTLALTYNNLAESYSALGDPSTAIIYHIKAMVIREKILPAGHPDIAQTYANLALNYESTADYSKSVEFNLKALSIRERSLPANHPHIARSYSNLSIVYNSLNEHNKALDLQLKSLSIWSAVLPENHPDLVIIYTNIATTYRYVGDCQKALEYNLKALVMGEKIFSPEHPELANIYNGLGSTYLELKDYQEALKYAYKAVIINEKSLGLRHPKTAMSYNNLGAAYFKINDYDQALEYNLKALSIREEKLPPAHPDLILTYNNLSVIYAKIKDYPKQLEYCLKVLLIREKMLLVNHPDIAWSYSNVSDAYGELGDYQKSLEYKLKALAIDERILPSDSEDLALYYVDLGLKYSKIKNYTQSIHAVKKSLAILQKNQNNNQSLLNISTIYLTIYHKDRATQYFDNDLYLPAKLDFDTAIILGAKGYVYNLRGLSHYYLKNYSQAISDFERSVQTDSTLSKTGYLNNLGTAYVKKGDYPLAKNAFESFEKLDPQNGRVFRNWAMYYALQNDKPRALENLQKAISLGYKDLKWITTDDSLENIRGEQAYKALIEQLQKQ